MKTAAAIAATVALAFTGVANADSYTKFFKSHPASTRKVCKSYWYLSLTLGWSDSRIIETLNDAGANMDRSYFNAVVKWCYNHG